MGFYVVLISYTLHLSSVYYCCVVGVVCVMCRCLECITFVWAPLRLFRSPCQLLRHPLFEEWGVDRLSHCGVVIVDVMVGGSTLLS